MEPYHFPPGSPIIFKWSPDAFATKLGAPFSGGPGALQPCYLEPWILVSNTLVSLRKGRNVRPLDSPM